MNVEDFFPKYPNAKRNEEFDLFNFYEDDKTLEQVLYDKKEFRDLKLSSAENEKLNEDDILFKHQKVISRFLSNFTPYDGILLFHEMGTGKTCAAFGVVENIRDTKDAKYTKAIVIMPNDIILKNNMLELAKTCTKGKYMPTDRDELAPKKLQSAIRKRVQDFYKFDTLGVFTKNLKNKDDNLIRKEYSNSIIIIDEIHNSVVAEDGVKLEQSQKDTYIQLHRLLHLVTNCKKILMTGTPMTDKPGEIALISNLLLPLDNQFPANVESFESEFMTKVPGTENKKVMRKEKEKEFKDKIRGYVSYLKSSMTLVKTNFVVNLNMPPQLKHFRVFVDEMHPFQSAKFLAVKGDAFDSLKKEASLFVYPNGFAGSGGFKAYFKERKEGGYAYIKPILSVDKSSSPEIKLQELRKYSSVYASTIQKILEHPTKNTLVFNSVVHGSGSVLFARLLEFFHFEPFQGIVDFTSSGRKRYALLTSETLKNPNLFRTIRQVYNDPRNKHGDLLQVVIFSRVASEGISFKNVQEIHIQTPHWNYAETSQAIARGMRANSHQDLIKEGVDVTVNIYQHCAVPVNEQTKTISYDNSIQLKLYVFSEEKDSSIKSVERLVKESAVDCQLFYKKNKFQVDGSRECDYQPCAYKCDGITQKNNPVTTGTYDLFYTQKNKAEIIKQIKLLFRYEFSYTFDELKENEKLRNFTLFELLSSLRQIIGENMVIINKYNFESYLREQADVYYLVEKLQVSSDFCSMSYTKQPIGSSKQLLPLVFKQYEEKLKEDLLKATTQIEADEILSRFTVEGQQSLLEKTLLPDSKIPPAMRNLIITYFSSKNPELQVKILSLDSGSSIRIEAKEQVVEWKDGKWKKIASKPVLDWNLPDKTLQGYIGLYRGEQPNPEDFLIQNWDETLGQIRSGVDNRDVRVGQQCKTMKGVGNLLVKLGVPIPPDDLKRLYAEPFLRGYNFISPSTEEEDVRNRQRLYEFLSNNLKPSLISDYSEKSSTDVLFRAYYFNKLLKQQQQCRILYNLFRENQCFYKDLMGSKTYGKEKKPYVDTIKQKLKEQEEGRRNEQEEEEAEEEAEEEEEEAEEEEEEEAEEGEQ